MVLLIGCIVPISALMPSVEGDVPSATGSHLAYWHWEDTGGEMWSNTVANDADDGGTTTREIIVATPTNQGYGFSVKANMSDDDVLDEPLYFEDNGQISGEAWVDISVTGITDLPTEITFYAYEEDGSGNRLNTWLTTVNYRDDGKYEFYIDIDGVTVPAGHVFAVGVNFEAQTGITTVTFHTSGESYCDLPLVVGSDGDGGDGGDGDGDGDGTDGNTTDGDGGDNSTVLIIIVIIVVVLILVAVVVGIRRRG